MRLPLNLNPILDEGAPTSTGGMTNATRICDLMGIPLSLDPPRSRYLHGWGINCEEARPVINSWDLNTQDKNGKPTTFTFDIVKGESPLILGLDVKRFATTDNMASPPYIRFKRPQDTEAREFRTYIESEDDGNDRIRFDIIPHNRTTMGSLMSNVRKPDLQVAKKLHRFTHAPIEEMTRLLTDAGKFTHSLASEYAKVHRSCDICASTGTPTPKRKISISHINTEFNNEIQADFVTIFIREERFEVLNIIDTGTKYGERVIAKDHSGETMINLIETAWFYHHGTPKSFSADPEFCKRFLSRFLQTHAITLNARPSRSSHKNGRVERNNGVFKNILARLSKEKTSASGATLIARASFMANLFHGSSTLSAFQLARGYSPSVIGIPSSVVPEYMLEAHIENVANRAVNTILRSRNHVTLRASQLPSGTDVWVFYKSSKQNEPVKWIKASVIEAGTHVVKCRRSQKGPPLTASYEDIRISPKGILAEELMTQSLEEAITDMTTDDDDIIEMNDENSHNANMDDGEDLHTRQDSDHPEDDDRNNVNTIGTQGVEAIPTRKASRPEMTDNLMSDIFGSDVDEHEHEDEITKRSLISGLKHGTPNRDIGVHVPK